MKIITNTIAFLFLAVIVWGLCQALVPAIDAEHQHQAEQAKQRQVMLHLR